MTILNEVLKQIAKAFGCVILAGVGICLAADSAYDYVKMGRED